MTTVVIVDPSHRIDYSSTSTPPSYTCGNCSKNGVKLWRSTGTFLGGMSLRCAYCAVEEQQLDINRLSAAGKYDGDYGPTDQIGSRIPAIPSEENDTFWGYTSVPQDGCDWWDRLRI